MKLYRIIDFFELVQTIHTAAFRIPSANRFLDPNELIGALFSTLMNPQFTPCTEMDVQKLIGSQDELRQSHYISCWTKTRDSIAMWEIYSPHRTSVQIEVDKEELSACFAKFAAQRSFAKAHYKSANHSEVYFYPLEVDECNYDDLALVHDRLKERTELLNSEAVSAIEQGRDADFRKLFEQACREAGERAHELFFLKDRAYSYEDEVRFVLRSVRRNSRPYDECEKDFGFVLFDTHLRPTTCEEAGDNIFVDFPSTLIKHIYLDGRAPEWLTYVQMTLLSGHEFEISRSPAYGAFVDRNPLQKWWK